MPNIEFVALSLDYAYLVGMAKLRSKDAVLLGIAVVLLAGAGFMVYRTFSNPNKPRPIPPEQTIEDWTGDESATDTSGGSQREPATRPIEERGTGFMRPPGS